MFEAKKGAMTYSERLITDYVERFEKKFEGDPDYKKYFDKLGKINNLGGITEVEVKSIIQPFLYTWGRMQRVLGEKRFSGWETKLVDRIRANSGKLEDFRTKHLSYTVLGEFEPDIKYCYQSLYEIVGKIAAAKILHLICPHFFPAWDNPIADAIFEEEIRVDDERQVEVPAQNERYVKRLLKKWERERKSQLRKSPPAQYYRFMQATQNFIKRYEPVLSALVTKYEKGILKISDECFWWATNRSLSLFFQEDWHASSTRQ